jgi:hypothetical protein
MAEVYDEITPDMAAFIARQHVFFVATAPPAGGRVNLSPKGYDSFRVHGGVPGRVQPHVDRRVAGARRGRRAGHPVVIVAGPSPASVLASAGTRWSSTNGRLSTLVK